MNALLAKIREQLGRASDREQRLLFITVATLVVFVLMGTYYLTESSLENKRKNLGLKRDQLSQVESLETKYDAAVQEEERAKRRLKSNKVSLFSTLQGAASRLGLDLRDLNERKVPVKDTEIDHVSVEVNLKEVSIDKLNQFLEAIEGRKQNGLVKITKMKISTRHDNAEYLNVNMTVSTWKERG